MVKKFIIQNNGRERWPEDTFIKNKKKFNPKKEVKIPVGEVGLDETKELVVEFEAPDKACSETIYWFQLVSKGKPFGVDLDVAFTV